MPYLTLLTLERNPPNQDRPELDVDVQLPPGLDPARCPIIAEHFYGWRPVGVVTAEIISDLRSRRQAEHLHARELR